MEEKGITYEELHNLSKVVPHTITRARNERIAFCKLATLEKLARALGVDVRELFEYIEEK